MNEQKINEKIREIEQSLSELQAELLNSHEHQAHTLVQQAQGLLYKARSTTVSEQIEMANTMFG